MDNTKVINDSVLIGIVAVILSVGIPGLLQATVIDSDDETAVEAPAAIEPDSSEPDFPGGDIHPPRPYENPGDEQAHPDDLDELIPDDRDPSEGFDSDSQINPP